MTDYKHEGSTWEWSEGTRGYSVRVFATTGRLIWSSWVSTAEGPQFDDGFAQPIEAFLAGDETPFPIPAAVRTELEAHLEQLNQLKSWSHRIMKWFGRK
ncbi:MAG: hypothetical protein SNJ59_07685 [Aggregatilineales bacterium]